MAKPILLLRIHRKAVKSFNEAQLWAAEKFSDYHTLVIPKSDEQKDDFEMEVFYEKDMTDIQFDELKLMVANSLKEFAIADAQQ